MFCLSKPLVQYLAELLEPFLLLKLRPTDLDIQTRVSIIAFTTNGTVNIVDIGAIEIHIFPKMPGGNTYFNKVKLLKGFSIKIYLRLVRYYLS